MRTKWLYPAAGICAVLALWQFFCVIKIVPVFALPSPANVFRALVLNMPQLLSHAKTTLFEAFVGLFAAVCASFVFAVLMDRFETLKKTLYPLLIISQTIPVVAIAPLLVLWMGYGALPKVTLIVLVCFFPLTIGLLDAFKSIDPDILSLFKAMGANRVKILIHAKLPCSTPAFFSGLKVAVAYSVVGAVISEWLGGSSGLGVYMTRVRKSYAFDKMFAVIFFISAISLLLIWLVTRLEKKSMPWKFARK